MRVKHRLKKNDIFKKVNIYFLSGHYSGNLFSLNCIWTDLKLFAPVVWFGSPPLISDILRAWSKLCFQQDSIGKIPEPFLCFGVQNNGWYFLAYSPVDMLLSYWGVFSTYWFCLCFPHLWRLNLQPDWNFLHFWSTAIMHYEDQECPGKASLTSF